MPLHLRIPYRKFKDNYQGHYGLYRSDKMVAASRAYKAYETELKKTPRDLQALKKTETDLIGTWAIWAQTKEFRTVNSSTNGMCKMVAVEIGAIPDVDRESNTTAFILYGERRWTNINKPKERKVCRVEVTAHTVPAYMKILKERGERVGIVLIDAFGAGDSIQKHGFNRRYGNQESTVLDNVKDVLRTAREHNMPLFEVTMQKADTWKELKDLFPTKVLSIDKPKQPLFAGDERYVQSALNKFREEELSNIVVMGWDANQCVAAAIFGVYTHTGEFVPGLLDFGLNVVTARNLLGANEDNQLESKWGWPHIGPPPKKNL
jgi:hypothetical protein